MIRAVALLALAACGGEKTKEAPPPAPAKPPVPVPDITSIDWANQVYDLASLGAVKATGGRAVFRIVEDENGVAHADQSPAAKDEWTGTLALEPARYADLDGDGHDEALLAFELASSRPDEVPRVFGVFAFTLRGGNPVRLDVVTSPVKLTIDGATLSTETPPRTWRWGADGFVAD